MISPIEITNLAPFIELDDIFHPPSPSPESFTSPCFSADPYEEIPPPKPIQIEALGNYLLQIQQNPERFEHLRGELYLNGMPLHVLDFWSEFLQNENANELLHQFSETIAFTPEFVQMSALLGSSFVRHLLDNCPQKVEQISLEPLQFFPQYLLQKMEISEETHLTFLIFINQPGVLQRVLFHYRERFFDLLVSHPNFCINILKNLEDLGMNRAEIFTQLRSWAKLRPFFDGQTHERLSKIFDNEIGHTGFWLLTKYQENIFLQDKISFSNEALGLILFNTKQGLNQFQEALPFLVQSSSKFGKELLPRVMGLFKKNLEYVFKSIHPVDHDALLRLALLPKKNEFSLKLVALINSKNFLWSNVASFFFNILLADLSKEDQFLLITQQDRLGKFLFSHSLAWLNLKPSAKMHLLKEISTIHKPVLENIHRIAKNEHLNKNEKLRIFEENRFKNFIRELDDVSQVSIFNMIEDTNPLPNPKKRRSVS